MQKKWCRISTVLVILSILLIVVALLVEFVAVPTIFKQNLEIKNGSVQYKNWYRPEVPVYMQWYIFNLTNVVNVTANKSEKPMFTQLGPYTYREFRWKTDITWNDNGTVTYKNLRWWTFMPDKSNGTEDDLIYSINLPLVTVAESLRYESTLIKVGFTLLADHYNETLYKNYTMRQLIWGYHDPMMKAATKLVKDWFYTDLVGIYAGKNYTDDGIWTVNTGENDIGTVGLTQLYNGTTHVNFWSSDYANMVNGSDGTIGQPNLSKDQSIYFFVPDLCRSLYAVYFDEEQTTENITLRRYSSSRAELKNATTNPDNAGFCTPAGNCLLGDGMMNLTTCQKLDHFNVPIIASLPHFLYADPKYLAKVEGLKPVESEHRTDIAIEPRTGLVMRIAKRLQINMYQKPVEYLPVLSGVQEMVFPVAWLTESATIDGKNQDTFLSLISMMDVVGVICYVVYGVGAVVAVVSAIILVTYCVKAKAGKSKQRKPLLSSSSVGDGDHADYGATSSTSATHTDMSADT